MNEDRLKPIKDRQWGPYRGSYALGWRRSAGPLDELCTRCPCGQWWGWTWDPERARTLVAKMERQGCPRCRRKKIRNRRRDH